MKCVWQEQPINTPDGAMRLHPSAIRCEGPVEERPSIERGVYLCARHHRHAIDSLKLLHEM